MRQQRCGYNPWVDAVCHSFDGRTVDGPMPAGSYVDARGGWHDAGDQLKYLLTSSNATAQMLLAYQLGEKQQFADRCRMTLASRRRTAFRMCWTKRGGGSIGCCGFIRRRISFITRWPMTAITRPAFACRRMRQWITDGGRAVHRAVYSADGKPQGLMKYKSESTGVANLAGRYAAAMALGYQIWKDDPQTAAVCRAVAVGGQRSLRDGKGSRGRSARQLVQIAVPICGNDLGGRYGVGRGRIISRDRRSDVIATMPSITPNSPARRAGSIKTKIGHYQYYPFMNAGHFRLYDLVDEEERQKLSGYYRDQIEHLRKARARQSVSASACRSFGARTI